MLIQVGLPFHMLLDNIIVTRVEQEQSAAGERISGNRGWVFRAS